VGRRFDGPIILSHAGRRFYSPDTECGILNPPSRRSP
jgi:hypothetical protein